MATRKGWGIEALGLEDSLQAFKDADAAFGAIPLKECLMPIAERMRDTAKRLVAIGAGKTPSGATRMHLRDLIFAAPGRSGEPSVIVGVDRKKAPQAHLVELGHGGPHPAPPHPYLRPAFFSLRSAAKNMLGTEINERIIKKLINGRRRLAR